MISGEIKVISEFPWVRLLLKSKFGDDPQSSAEMWIVFLKGGEGSFNLFWYVVFLCDLFVFSFVCLFVCFVCHFVVFKDWNRWCYFERKFKFEVSNLSCRKTHIYSYPQRHHGDSIDIEFLVAFLLTPSKFFTSSG